MQWLMLFPIDEQVEMDYMECLQTIMNIPGVRRIKTDYSQMAFHLPEMKDMRAGLTHEFGEPVIEWGYHFGAHFVMGWLAKDLRTISLWGASDAAMKMALELGAHWVTPLHVANGNYDFDLPVSSIRNLEEFRRIAA